MTRRQHSVSLKHLGLLLLAILALGSFASAEWNEQVLYSFQGGDSDGALPVGGIVINSAGNIYGATTQGGGQCAPGQCGTVFQLTPPAKKGGAWSETVLYIFKGFTQGGTDGSLPAGGLVMDRSGNLYGTTGYGGTGNCVLLGTKVGCGTVYELSPPGQQGGSWTETVLYSFQSGKDGYLPNGDLVFDKAGNLYGATMYGGGYGSCNALYYPYCGTVFELSPPKQKGGKWTEKVLYSFKGIASGKQYGDAESPNGGLVLDGKGAIYGTSFNGGYAGPNCANFGCGTVFELKPPKTRGGAWKEQLIHIFKDGNDGAGPNAGVIFGANGLLYGAAQGGAKVGGVVFGLGPDGGGRWKETVLYEFSSDTYSYIPSVALFDSNGRLYGTTETVPDQYGGTVFRLESPGGKGKSWTLSFLYEFQGGPDGAFPNPYLVRDKAGDLYGSTAEGGGRGNCQGYCGTIFKVSP